MFKRFVYIVTMRSQLTVRGAETNFFPKIFPYIKITSLSIYTMSVSEPWGLNAVLCIHHQHEGRNAIPQPIATVCCFVKLVKEQYFMNDVFIY